MRISLQFTCKYTLIFNENYVFVEKYNFLLNLKTNRILKQITKGGSIGYVIQGKFYTLTYLRTQLTKIKKQETPF
jgi:hypothetical protein